MQVAAGAPLLIRYGHASTAEAALYYGIAEQREITGDHGRSREGIAEQRDGHTTRRGDDGRSRGGHTTEPGGGGDAPPGMLLPTSARRLWLHQLSRSKPAAPTEAQLLRRLRHVNPHWCTHSTPAPQVAS